MLRLLLMIVILSYSFEKALAQPALTFPDITTGETHYKNQEYIKAFEHFYPLAQKEYDDAQLYLGRLYAKGYGVEQDHQKALHYFRKAAEKNNAKAQFEIANAHQKGYGLEKNIEVAKKWYRLSAQNGYERATKRLSEINGIPYTALNRYKKSAKTRFSFSFKDQFIIEDNLSLGMPNTSETANIIEAKISGYHKATPDLILYGQIRGIHSDGIALSDNEDDADTRNQDYIEVRQAWAEFKDLANIAPLSIKFGRQRFKEDRTIWWNRDLDAARLSFDTTLTSGFFAIGQNLGKYRIGDESELEEDEKQRLRFLGQASHNYGKNHFAEFRFLYEHDHSKKVQIGQNIQTHDRDAEDFDLLWSGLRLRGGTKNLKTKLPISYRTEIIGLIGEERILQTQTGPSPDLRTISNINKRDVTAWAFDAGIEIPLIFQNEPKFIINYTYASGDNGKGNNSAFRQTGLDGNTSYFPSYNKNSALRNFGEVLRPELSNIHILNLGTHIPVFNYSDLNFNYFSYWRANENTNIRSNGLNTRLASLGNHIGQALDFSFNYLIGKELVLPHLMAKNSSLRLKTGAFYSGNAYGTQDQEMAYRSTIELKTQF